MPPHTTTVGKLEMLIQADMRAPKPGLELSFHAGESLEGASDNARLVIIEAHSERAKKWLVDRFGRAKIKESFEPRLTNEIPNLGYVMEFVTEELEAEVAKFELVTQWNPAHRLKPLDG